MILVEVHKITKDHQFYDEMDSLCFDSKNLYNKALYIIRQEFITTYKEKGTGNYFNYNHMNRLMIQTNDVDYRKLPAKIANQTLMILDKNWKSFFNAIKDWKLNPSKYKGKPNLPNYLDKVNGRFLTSYELGAISKSKLKEGLIKLSGTNLCLPFINKEKGKLKCVRLVPTVNDMIKFEIVYEVKQKDLGLERESILSIDLGVTNLMTLTSNVKGFVPLIINGGKLKSVNQFYNKTKALLFSELPKGVYTSKAIKRLTLNRENVMSDESHKVSKFVVDLCKKWDIGKIVIGKNEGWKDSVNLGGRNNQNFVGIPYNSFIGKIEYKGKLLGIDVKVNEESFTSKASFKDLDPLPKYKKGYKNEVKFSGKRITRSFYRRDSGEVINADVNGSYNILRKELINGGKDLTFEMIAVFAVIPVRVKSTNEYHRFL